MDDRHNEENKLSREAADKLISIFQIPHPDRSFEEHQEAFSILRELEFFRSRFSEDLKREQFLEKCAVAMKLEFFPPGSAIYHYGETSNKIYIVVKGRIRRYVKRAIEMAFDDSPKKYSQLKDFNQSILLSSPANSELVKSDAFQHSVVQVENHSSPSRKSISPVISKCNSPMMGIQTPIAFQDYTPQTNKGVSPLSRKLKFGSRQQTMGESTNPHSGHRLNKRWSISQNDSPSNSSPKKKMKGVLFKSKTNQISLFSQAVDQLQAETSPTLQVAPLGQLLELTPLSLDTTFTLQLDQEDNFKKYRNYVFEERPVFERFVEHKHKYFIAGEFAFAHRRTYHPGESFGEMGVTFDSQRIASLVTETSACVLSIDKTAFKRISSEEIKYHKDKVQFLQSLFPTFPPKNVSDFASYFQRKVVYQNSAIYKQGNSADSLYLIRDGEIVFSRRETIIEESKEKPTPRGTSKAVERTLNIATLTTKQFFGEEVLVKKTPKRVFTATVAGHRCIILKISKKNLWMLRDLYPGIVKQIEAECQAKSQWRSDRINILVEKARAATISKPLKLEVNNNSMTQKIDEIVNEKVVAANAEDEFRDVIENEQGFPRFTSKKLNYKELSPEEQDQLERLADVKLRVSHDQLKAKNKYELYHASPIQRTQEPFSIWKMNLKKRGIYHPVVRSLLKYRYGDEEAGIKQEPIKRENRNSVSLKSLNNSVSRIIQKRSPQGHEHSSVKSIPSFVDSSKMLSNLNQSVINESGMKNPILANISLPEIKIERSLNPSRRESVVGSGSHVKYRSEVSSMLNREGMRTIDTSAVPSIDLSKMYEQERQGRKRSSVSSSKLLSLVPSKTNSPVPERKSNATILDLAPVKRGSIPSLHTSTQINLDESISIPYHYKSSYQKKKNHILAPFFGENHLS